MSQVPIHTMSHQSVMLRFSVLDLMRKVFTTCPHCHGSNKLPTNQHSETDDLEKGQEFTRTEKQKLDPELESTSNYKIFKFEIKLHVFPLLAARV